MKLLAVEGVGQVSRIGLGTWQFGTRDGGTGTSMQRAPPSTSCTAPLSSGDPVRHGGELRRPEERTHPRQGVGQQPGVGGGGQQDLPDRPVPADRAAASAGRLQLKKIPLYQVHQANPVVPDSAIMRGMRTLLDDGRIGAVGVSNYSLARWRKADQALVQPVVSNQVQSPLAQGLLGGKYTVGHRPGGVRALSPLFGRENLRRVQPLLDTLQGVAAAHQVKPAQVALAWLLSMPQVVVIPGASSVEQLEFNVAAADLELNPDSVVALTAAAAEFSRSPRCAPWSMQHGTRSGLRSGD